MDIGIIIALQEEFDLFFPEIRKLCKFDRDEKTGDVAYLFTQPSDNPDKPYNCVASFVGRMGPTEAALATQQMITKWNPRNIVMLGLAAGISKDVRLGDIIVADSVDSYADRGRMGEANDIEFSGQVYQCSAELTRFVDNFKFTNTPLHESWRRNCSQRLRRSMPKQALEELNRAGLVSLKPTYHIGPLASGPFVVASSSFREKLLKRNRIFLGVEMEAGGMMTAIRKHADQQRSLVIRGVSDYGDERKKETDAIGAGGFRRYAMNNSIRLLWNLLAASALPHSSSTLTNDKSTTGGGSGTSRRHSVPNLALHPTAGPHGVLHPSNEKYVDNGHFRVEAEFHLSVGRVPIDILSIIGQLWVRNACCLLSEPRAKIDNNPITFNNDWETITSPIRLDAGKTILFWYLRNLRPPTMKQAPVDCEDGLLKIILRYKEPGSLEIHEKAFCFLTSRAWDLRPTECDQKL